MRALAFTVSVGILAAGAIRAHDARACSIVLPHAVLPSFGAPAPRNAHVWIEALPMPLFIGASFVLVKSDAPRAPVPVDFRSFESAGMVWELAPRALLDARSRYEVWAAPRDKKAPLLLGVFTTSDDIDTTAPAPPNLTSAEPSYDALTGCPPTIDIAGTPGTDASGEVLHAVWLSDGAGNIDYRQPPNELVAWPKPSSQDRAPRAEIFATFPARHAGVRRIGVRAVDVAGNLSAPAVVDVTAQ